MLIHQPYRVDGGKVRFVVGRRSRGEGVEDTRRISCCPWPWSRKVRDWDQKNARLNGSYYHVETGIDEAGANRLCTVYVRAVRFAGALRRGTVAARRRIVSQRTDVHPVSHSGPPTVPGAARIRKGWEKGVHVEVLDCSGNRWGLRRALDDGSIRPIIAPQNPDRGPRFSRSSGGSDSVAKMSQD